jgi:hypothetical protein
MTESGIGGIGESGSGLGAGSMGSTGEGAMLGLNVKMSVLSRTLSAVLVSYR